MIPLPSQLACALRQTDKLKKRLDAALRQGGNTVNRHAWENEIKNMQAICQTLQKCVWLEEVSEEMKARVAICRGFCEVKGVCTTTA